MRIPLGMFKGKLCEDTSGQEPIGAHGEVSRQRAQATGTGERRERGAQNGAP